MKYTTVFLDFDDTLIDTQGYASKCLGQIYHKYNVSKCFPTLDNFLEVYHASTHQLWEDYALGEIDKETLLATRFTRPFAKFAVPKEDIEQMNNDFMTLVVNNNQYIEGAKEVLEYLKPKYKIVMLSNGFSELQYDKLKNVGFTNYFDDVILSDVIGVNKPHPDIFTFALNKIGTTAKQSIMVGDSLLADIEGAMNSDIDQIWYNPENKSADIQPTHTIGCLKEIMEIL